MSSMSLPAIEVQEKLIGEVRDHPNGSRIGAYCFDVLSGQAEGRALYAGRRMMRARASNHRLTREDTESSYGNVLDILERGPERSAEWALVSAFAVRGLEERLVESSAGERREVVERFARHADWLELSTSYAPYRFVPDLLSEASRDTLLEALETFVQSPADGPSVAAHRARAVLRLHVLSILDRPSAQDAFARVVETHPDPWLKTLAEHAFGNRPLPSNDAHEVRGAWGKLPRLSVWRVLQYVSGLTLLTGLGRFLAFGLGLERMARVRLETNAVHVHRETKLFGRTVRVSDASYALKDVECATREVSMPTFQVLFGAVALVLGVVCGSIWMSDGLVRGDHELFITGVIALTAGAGLDLVFAGWGSLRRSRAGFEMFVDNECVAALRRVDPERAQRMVRQIAARRPVV